MQTLRLGVALVLVVLIGCSGMTPEPTPEELLRGSWYITVPWIDDGGEEVGTENHVLTFTKSRWIQHRARYHLDGREGPSWARSGAWSVTDDTITRTWIDYDDGSVRHVDKDFRIEDDELQVDRWTAHSQVDDIWTYQRMPSLIKEDLYGRWRAHAVRSSGDFPYETMTLTVGDECSWRHEYRSEPDGMPEYDEAIGTCEVDMEELRIEFVVSRVHVEPELPWNVVGGPLMFAVAPRADSTTGIVVSGYWHEQIYNAETDRWEHGTPSTTPYGRYDLSLEKVEQ